jgi:uncharacterized membrane protein YbhN (UPF0104 family)
MDDYSHIKERQGQLTAMSKKGSIFGYISFIASIILVLFLLSLVDLSEMINTLLRVKLSYYLFAFILYTFTYVARAGRLYVLFGPHKFNDFFFISCGHMLLNHVLPFRTGEFSLLFFLKRITKSPYSKSIPILLLLRIFDVMVLILTFLFLVIFFGFNVDIYVVVITCVVLALSVLCTLKLKKIFYFVKLLLNKLPAVKRRKKVDEFYLLIEQALTISPGKMVKLFFLSLLDRLFLYAVTVFLVLGMSFDIPIYQLVTANAAASLVSVFPINSFGNFGTLELGWTGALLYFGLPPDIAVSSGFGFHLLGLSFIIILGMSSLLIMKMKFNINPFRKMDLE